MYDSGRTSPEASPHASFPRMTSVTHGLLQQQPPLPTASARLSHTSSLEQPSVKQFPYHLNASQHFPTDVRITTTYNLRRSAPVAMDNSEMHLASPTMQKLEQQRSEVMHAPSAMLVDTAPTVSEEHPAHTLLAHSNANMPPSAIAGAIPFASASPIHGTAFARTNAGMLPSLPAAYTSSQPFGPAPTLPAFHPPTFLPPTASASTTMPEGRLIRQAYVPSPSAGVLPTLPTAYTSMAPSSSPIMTPYHPVPEVNAAAAPAPITLPDDHPVVRQRPPTRRNP